MAKVTFNNSNNVFFAALKEAADNYFTSKGIKRTGNWKLYLKSAVLIPSALLIYISLLSWGLDMPVYVALVLCGLLGATLASIGFNVMHDACHGSYSSKKWINNVMGLTINAMGGNAFIWKFKHNIVHHTYTNIDGIDDDIAKSPIIRQCSTQKWVPAHRLQHIYIVGVYAISSFAWVFLLDILKYAKQRVLSTPLQRMDTREHVIFWLSKLAYVLFYVALPVFFLGWGPWAIGFSVMHIVLGLILAIVFQLAHVVEDAEFEFAGTDSKQIDNEWAIHQVKTTANFAADNKIVSWFVGGLNFQIEHHLFPKVSHVHYHALSKIVQETCNKFQLNYNYNPTLGKAISSHFRMIRDLGRKPRAMMSPQPA